MRGRRLWMKLDSQSGVVKVYVTKNQLKVEDGTLVDACFDPHANTIEIKWSEDLHHMKMKLLHELLHVCFNPHAGDMKQNILGGKDYIEWDTREELLVSFLEPILFDLLVRNGMVRFPNPPKP